MDPKEQQVNIHVDADKDYYQLGFHPSLYFVPLPSC
jgi:hypothetical protein